MNKDNLFGCKGTVLLVGAFFWRGCKGTVLMQSKNRPPQAGVGCFLRCTPQKRAFITVINQRAVCFPHTQPHTMAILIVNVENNFYLCI